MTLLKWAIRVGRRHSELTDSILSAYHSRLQTKLDELLKIVPELGSRKTASAGEKLQRSIKKYRQNLFVFVTNRAIPPTNNGSERALRPCVVFRKVINCFRSEWGAKLSVSVRSVVETARRQNPRCHTTYPRRIAAPHRPITGNHNCRRPRFLESSDEGCGKITPRMVRPQPRE